MKKKGYFLAGLLFVAGYAPVSSAYTEGFSGYYDVANWTKTLDGGSVDTTGEPASITLTSSNTGSGVPSSQDFTIASAGDGLVSFSWTFVATDVDDPGYDPFGYLLNGVFTKVTDDSGSALQSGTTSFNVSAGDIFGFRAYSTDSKFGSSITVVSDFAAPPAAVPLPAAVWMFGSGLLALLGFNRRKAKLSAQAV